MSYKEIKVVKRTLYQTKCECGWTDEREDSPPREIKCPKCGAWNRYETIEWTGPSNFGDE